MGLKTCVRCGDDDTGDLRTLWMACGAEMLYPNSAPFEEQAIHGQLCPRIGMRKLPHHDRETPVFDSPLPNHGTQRIFYTLTVCKSCRGDWLDAIQTWWVDRPKPPKDLWVLYDDIQGTVAGTSEEPQQAPWKHFVEVQ